MAVQLQKCVSQIVLRFRVVWLDLQCLVSRVYLRTCRTRNLTPIGPNIAFVWQNLPMPVLVITAGLSQVSEYAIEAA